MPILRIIGEEDEECDEDEKERKGTKKSLAWIPMANFRGHVVCVFWIQTQRTLNEKCLPTTFHAHVWKVIAQRLPTRIGRDMKLSRYLRKIEDQQHSFHFPLEWTQWNAKLTLTSQCQMREIKKVIIRVEFNTYMTASTHVGHVSFTCLAKQNGRRKPTCRRESIC